MLGRGFWYDYTFGNCSASREVQGSGIGVYEIDWNLFCATVDFGACNDGPHGPYTWRTSGGPLVGKGGDLVGPMAASGTNRCSQNDPLPRANLDDVRSAKGADESTRFHGW